MLARLIRFLKKSKVNRKLYYIFCKITFDQCFLPMVCVSILTKVYPLLLLLASLLTKHAIKCTVVEISPL